MDKTEIQVMALRELAKRTLSEKLKAEEINIKDIPWPVFASQTKIRSGKNVLSFVPYQYQKKLVELWNKYHRVMVVKTRQMGITETAANRLLQKCRNNPAYAAAVFSKTEDDAHDVSRRVNSSGLSYGLRWAGNSLQRLEAQNGGVLFFRASNDDSARGLPSIHDLMFDEAAVPKNFAELYSNAVPTQEMVGDDAGIIIISTPKGRANEFYRMLDEGNPDGTNLVEIANQVRAGKLYSENLPGFYYFVDSAGWAKVFIHWLAHPIYSKDPDYLAKTKRKYKLTEPKLQREFNLSFDDSDENIFAHYLVKEACSYRCPRVPRQGNKYIVGIDPNQGGADFFCLVVLDVTFYPYRVADYYYKNKARIAESLVHIIELIDKYKPEYINIEVNNSAAVFEIIENRFGNEILVNPVNQTSKTKITNTDKILYLMEDKNLWLPEEEFVQEEFENFIDIDGSRGARPGYHDDFVMALSVALNQTKPEEREMDILEWLKVMTGRASAFADISLD